LAFNTKSDILILDEPASHLDQKWQNWMDQMIVLNAKDKVVFIASNEHPVELKRCTRLIDLNLNDQP
jgi:ABC-type transport system involved in cytochrome bd biosynthesis fused ATPase/permease subunit